jgi:hypothetical protein
MPPRNDPREKPSLVVVMLIAALLAIIITVGVVQLSRMYTPAAAREARGLGAADLRASLIRHRSSASDAA